MSQLQVGIVIPCYNGARYVEAAVRSVLAQSAPPSKIIVVDDGSTDDTPRVLESLTAESAGLMVVRQENSGVSAARNAGFARLGPEIDSVLFLDSDDVLEPFALETLTRALRNRPDAGAVAGANRRIDERGRRLSPGVTDAPVVFTATERGVSRGPVPETLGVWDIVPCNPILTPGQCLIRRGALWPSPFRSEFTPCEDWELWLCLARRIAIATIPTVVLAYRNHSAGLSKRYAILRRQRQRLIQSFFRSVPADEEAKAARAYYFAVYGYDEGLCRSWAADAWRSWRLGHALVFLARAARLRGRRWWATILSECR